MDKSDTRRPVALRAPARAPVSFPTNMIVGCLDHLGCCAWQRSRLSDYAQSDEPSGECTHRLE
eukprot:6558444-Lingulodinium_polyedra.AAC.1